MISPRFGGFPGFEIAYSDLMENISVTLSSQSGTIFLSPMLMQFQDLAWSGLSVNKGGKEGKGLTLVGLVEVINHALSQSNILGIMQCATLSLSKLNTNLSFMGFLLFLSWTVDLSY
ncbi:PREDICTED: protein GAMETE EXPRESSED 2-like [Nelumbo nucifera]|uniref:Protein GAMETE EXPRESSED 2-like n=1 Tax=Nelumbo nucifera TaxID=4432 RepID=A0A1U8PXZ9_NELNU|nr:PREDICTED: protein GAMETE EXPRESSED 2-like [Nelumbo nucifera]